MYIINFIQKKGKKLKILRRKAISKSDIFELELES